MDKGWLDPNPPRSEDVSLVDDVSKAMRKAPRSGPTS